MNKVTKFLHSLNIIQRAIFGIIVPLIIYLITYPIARNIDYRPFDFEDTWYVWALSLCVILFFEYIIWNNINDK